MNDWPTPSHTGPVILFDGVCNLCNASVNFILDRDPREVFRFAALQSDAAKQLLATLDARALGERLDTMVLVEGGRLYVRSTAALRIVRHLPGAWKLFVVFVVVPRFVRDFIYGIVAARRLRWFGRRETCRVPTPELRARFLEATHTT